jgi:hypothetical protein
LASCCCKCGNAGEDCHKTNKDDGDERQDGTWTTAFPFVQDPPSYIEFNLVPLPLLTDEGQQTPIGGRGWYSSAVLSAMLLCGHDRLHRDLFSSTTKRQMMIELGSGSLGLSGITLAWIMAQKQQQQQQQQRTGRKIKIVLTDYDPDVLGQLEQNVDDTNRRLKDYFARSSFDVVSSVELTSAHLDWTEYDREQPLLVGAGGGEDEDKKYTVTFVCGAALVYTEETESCVDQIAKILQQNPQAAVWVVQWPRNGWFPLLQIQLQQVYGCTVEKFSVTDIHPQIHDLANTFMPAQQNELDLNHVKAIRITAAQTG